MLPPTSRDSSLSLPPMYALPPMSKSFSSVRLPDTRKSPPTSTSTPFPFPSIDAIPPFAALNECCETAYVYLGKFQRLGRFELTPNIHVPGDLASTDSGHSSDVELCRFDQAGYVDGAPDVNLFDIGCSLDFERAAYVHFFPGDGSSNLEDSSYIKIVSTGVPAYLQRFVDCNCSCFKGSVDG